ncbi:MAG: hypothetical protein AAGI34_15630 [Pseudomonadota bacterium]
MLSRKQLCQLAGADQEWFNVLRRRNFYPLFEGEPPVDDDAQPSGHKTHRLWDCIGLALLRAAIDQDGPLDEDTLVAKRVLSNAGRGEVALLPGAGALASACRLVRQGEFQIHRTHPDWLHRNGTAPDIHLASVVFDQGPGSELTSDVFAAPLEGVIARAHQPSKRIVGRPVRVSRLFTVNVSQVWRLIVERAEKAEIDLGVAQA